MSMLAMLIPLLPVVAMVSSLHILDWLKQEQTWKKLQAVQAALADILPEITLFWGHFEVNILYFLLKLEKEELTMEN